MKIQNSKFIILYNKDINKHHIFLDNILLEGGKEIDENFFIILGNAYLGNKLVNKLWVVKKIKEKRYKDIEELNGSFAIIFFNNDLNLTIITDRFLSKKIYFFENNEFTIISNNLVNISKFALKKKVVTFNNINKNAIFEFLNFRRLYGEKTFFNSHPFCF